MYAAQFSVALERDSEEGTARKTGVVHPNLTPNPNPTPEALV
jgi:hypothetical protein